MISEKDVFTDRENACLQITGTTGLTIPAACSGNTPDMLSQ